MGTGAADRARHIVAQPDRRRSPAGDPLGEHGNGPAFAVQGARKRLLAVGARSHYASAIARGAAAQCAARVAPFAVGAPDDHTGAVFCRAVAALRATRGEPAVLVECDDATAVAGGACAGGPAAAAVLAVGARSSDAAPADARAKTGLQASGQLAAVCSDRLTGVADQRAGASQAAPLGCGAPCVTAGYALASQRLAKAELPTMFALLAVGVVQRDTDSRGGVTGQTDLARAAAVAPAHQRRSAVAVRADRARTRAVYGTAAKGVAGLAAARATLAADHAAARIGSTSAGFATGLAALAVVVGGCRAGAVDGPALTALGAQVAIQAVAVRADEAVVAPSRAHAALGARGRSPAQVGQAAAAAVAIEFAAAVQALGTRIALLAARKAGRQERAQQSDSQQGPGSDHGRAPAAWLRSERSTSRERPSTAIPPVRRHQSAQPARARPDRLPQMALRGPKWTTAQASEYAGEMIDQITSWPCELPGPEFRFLGARSGT